MNNDEKGLVEMPDVNLETRDNFGKALTKASEIYSNNLFIRAVITAIPHVGGSIDILLSNRAQSIFQNRVVRFISFLAKEMETLKANEVNKEYFESEEGFDLLLKAFDAAIKTRNEEKIALYAKVLRGAAEFRNSDICLGEQFLSILAELSLDEICLLKIIYSMQKDKPADIENELHWVNEHDWGNLPNKCPQYIKDNLTFYLKRLEKTGLISQIITIFPSYKNPSEGRYIISNTLIELMRFIGV